MSAVFCEDHLRVWRAWGKNHYNPHRASEPGGGPLMDGRTAHSERRKLWEEFRARQMDLVVQICRDRCPRQEA